MAQNLDFLKQLAHGMAVQFGSSTIYLKKI